MTAAVKSALIPVREVCYNSYDNRDGQMTEHGMAEFCPHRKEMIG